MTDDELRTLHKRLSESPHIHDTAAAEVRCLKSEDIERLATYDREAGRRTNKRARVLMATILMLLAIVSFVYRLHNGRWTDGPFPLIWWALYALGLYALSKIDDRSSRTTIAGALCYTNDPGTVKLALRMLRDAHGIRKFFSVRS